MGKYWRWLAAGVGTGACVVAIGCATGKASTSGLRSAAPTISQVSPQSIPAGAPSQTLRVIGTNFDAKSVILWNGNALNTTQVDANTLAGAVDGSIIATPATVQLQVRNTSDGQQSAAVPVTVAATASASTVQALTITTSSLATATAGAGYSQTLQAAGGTPGYTWSIASGALPAGLNFLPSGTISGSPTVTGNYNVTLTVTDSASPAATKSSSFAIFVAPSSILTLSPSTMAPAVKGSAYTQALQAAGGTMPYLWSVTSGGLPAGLTLSPATGVISGTPTATGMTTVTITVTDSTNPAQTQSANFTIAVVSSALVLNSATLANATVNSAYSQSLQAAGGTAPYGWTVSSGALPAGLTLSTSTGTISGTPTTSGTFNFNVAVTDAGSPAQSKLASFSIAVAPSALSLNGAALAFATVNIAYSQNLQATGGMAPYGWTVNSGALPAGLTLSSAGTISGTPMTVGTFNFTVAVTDVGSPVQSKLASLSITVAGPNLAIATTTLAIGTRGTSYSQSLQATGGSAPYSWSIPSGLPPGLNLSPSTGLITGTPTATGNFTFPTTVMDASSPAQSRTATVSLSTTAPALSLVTSGLAAGTVNASYSQSLQAAGGTGPYLWSISGSLPAGLTLTPSTGIISGTATTSGSFNFAATVTDAGSPAQTQTANLTIAIAAPALSISTGSLPFGAINTAYSQTLQTSGGTAPFSWSMYGSLPAGLTLASSTGVISGTPTASGTFSVTITVSDASSPVQTLSKAFSITIAGTALSITSSTLTGGATATAYSQSLQAAGGVTPYNWQVTSGSLPAGLTLASSTGIISGTPTSSGVANFTVSVTDSSSPVQTKSAATSIVITVAPLAIASVNLVPGISGIAYAQLLVATGGTPGYNWSYSGTLPAGLSLAASTGVISGLPTITGTSNVTLTVTDNSAPTQTRSINAAITVAAAAAAPSGPGTTWYIRTDGGTRYSANATTGQCDGKADLPYGGVGTNQHCAFNDYRFLYDDQSYQNNAWVISGGDTVIVRGGPWRIGFDQGASYSDKWCKGNGPYSCFNPDLPVGTPTQHTRILGENYASCSATNKTQLFGGFGVSINLNLHGAQYVDVGCLEITRHSQCTRHGQPALPSQCNTSVPLDDYNGAGITTGNTTHDLTMTDMWIHGNVDRGIIGPIGANVTCLRCNISYNVMAGWDFDDGNSTPYGPNASWNFLYSQIEWNGCVQEYPITHTFPAIACYSQSTGGYGDGVGTPAGTGTGMSIVVDHSVFDHNTQDGLDLLHMDAGINNLSVTNSQSYSNNGAQFKWGGNFQNVTFLNNTVISNCLRMSMPIPGAPSSFNANLQDFCRAQDAILINFNQGSQTTFLNNTIVSYSPTTFDIACGEASCTNSVFTFKNNVVLAFDNPTTYNTGGQQGGPGGFYYQNSIGSTVRSNNIYYGLRNIHCPTGYTSEFCTSPLLVNQPTWTGEASLDNFNFTPTPGSPAKGAGIPLPAVTLDLNGLLRGNPPSIGAIE